MEYKKGYLSMRLILNSKKKAQSLIEYALILAMVAVVAIAALQLLGNNIGKALGQAGGVVGTGADQSGEQACTAMNAGLSGSGASGSFSWDSTNNKCSFSSGNE